MPSNRPTVSWRRSAATVIAIAWSADRWRTLLAFVLLGARAIVQTLFAYWLKLMLDGIAGRDPAPRRWPMPAAGSSPRSAVSCATA
jgi:hypothetical protein